MSPKELAARHPRLFHLTAPYAWPSIRTHGLLPTQTLLRRIGLDDPKIRHLTHKPRPHRTYFHETELGPIELNDNSPLSLKKLETCLDGMEPWEWCELLAQRVFFWADEKRGLSRLENAKRNRGKIRDVLVISTFDLATAYADQIELCPLNSGSTIHRPALRGRWLFARMKDHTFEDWSHLRQRKQAECGWPITQATDKILEVTIPGPVPDLADFVVERRRYENGAYQLMPL
jgi:hypothetical protein